HDEDAAFRDVFDARVDGVRVVAAMDGGEGDVGGAREQTARRRRGLLSGEGRRLLRGRRHGDLQRGDLRGRRGGRGDLERGDLRGRGGRRGHLERRDVRGRRRGGRRRGRGRCSGGCRRKPCRGPLLHAARRKRRRDATACIAEHVDGLQTAVGAPG